MKLIKGMSGIIALVVMLAGCADMSQTQQRTLTGAAGGAALGGIIGAAAGNAGMGAAVGAGLGRDRRFSPGQAQRVGESSLRTRPRIGEPRSVDSVKSDRREKTMQHIIQQLPGASELRRNWGWFLILGIVLIVLGTIALGSALLMTIASVFFFGWILIIGGVLEAFHAFWREKRWGGFLLDLLTGILYVVVGWMMVTNPQESALLLTLIIAMFLVFEGVFRIAAALTARYPHWGWVLFNGVISLILGIMIWRQWPYSGLWVIGLFVGIEMLLNGWSLVMLSLASRNLPEETLAARGPLRPQSA